MHTSPFILIITGPAGSGKSTVSARLSKQFRNCVHIETDQIKHLVTTGFKYDETKVGQKQWKLLGTNIGLLAKNFHQQKYKIIINGCVDETTWQNLEQQIEITHKILLLPDLNTTMKRDARRTIKARIGKKAITEHYELFQSTYFKDFTTINSANHTITQTVNAIKKIIQKKK